MSTHADPEVAVVLSIGEVAASTGLRASALRYYEELELIEPAGRRGGRRVYDPDVLPRLAFIALCQEVGFTLAEIGELLHHRGDAAQQWRRTAERKLEEIDRRMQRLRTMRGHLRAALACDCGHIEGCEQVRSAADRRREQTADAGARAGTVAAAPSTARLDVHPPRDLPPTGSRRPTTRRG